MIHFGSGLSVPLATREYVTWEREVERHHIYSVWAIAFRRDDYLYLIEMLDDGMQGL